jgi:uncharacterized repeat protein (TIGR03803 family)
VEVFFAMTRPALSLVGSIEISLVILLSIGCCAAQTESVIHAFQSNSVTDGAFPIGGVVADSQGALYGTTSLGGKNRDGTIYKLSPPATQGDTWKQNILYSFASGASGASPSGNLILTKTGKIYGAATGEDNAIVFELAPPAKSGESWSESVAFQFSSSSQALAGISSLIFDGKSRIYGTTYGGGRYKSGSVFVLTLANGFWKEQDIYSFQENGGTLVSPGGLVLNSSGMLYGVASYSGAAGSIAGTVFSLTPPQSGGGAWTENVLHGFGSGNDGSLPIGTLVLDSAGAIYGTTEQGGATGNGTVFQLVPPSAPGGAWTENIIYSFLDGSDGAEPRSGVVFDNTGALYGTTQIGGDFSCGSNGLDLGCGTAFELEPPAAQGGAWSEQTLYAFAGLSDGVDPGESSLLISGKTLYGTTFEGGDPEANSGMGCGTVFEITQQLT